MWCSLGVIASSNSCGRQREISSSPELSADKEVRFSTRVGVVLVPSRLDFKEQEREALWWGIDDYIEFREQFKCYSRMLLRLNLDLNRDEPLEVG